jgi:PadR family transcriptional regulator, regulatory protein PadR
MDRSTISYNAALVLQALASGVGYGFEVMRRAQLQSGTVYPLLRRLEDGGLVRSRWESESKAHGEGRPPRRYYEITAAGSRSLAAARERLSLQRALFDGPMPKADGRRG